MNTYCGYDCCKECTRLLECGGCEKCHGHHHSIQKLE